MSIMDKALPNVVEQTVTTPNTEEVELAEQQVAESQGCLLYTSPSPRDGLLSRMPSSA